MEGGGAPAYDDAVRSWIARLLPRLADCEGVRIEDKVYSLSIHYRAARHKRSALRSIDAAIRHLPGTHRIQGRQVVNLVPRGAPSWFQLNTRDYDAAVDFLRDVFHWETQAVSDAPEFATRC